MNEPYQPADAADRECAWRHAFAYADCHVSTEAAVKYANFYMASVADEDDMVHWPSHGEFFADWKAGLTEAAREAIGV